MATVTVSFRASPELVAELDAVAKKAGRERAAIVADFVMSGLEANKSPGGGQTIDIRKILEAISELQTGVQAISDGLQGFPSSIVTLWSAKAGPVLQDEIGSAIAPDLEKLRQAMRFTLGNFIYYGNPKFGKQEIKALLDEAFEN